jgi:hypothetical protein
METIIKTTEEIRLTSENPSQEYQKLLSFFANDSAETADMTGHPIVSNIANEIQILASKNKSCEYELYAACNAAEIWFNQIDEQFN